MMKKQGKIAFIGGKLDHSLLPVVYSELSKHLPEPLLLDAILVNGQLSLEAITPLFEQGYLGGCITLPHKIRMFELSGTMTERAQQAGAVNIIRFSLANTGDTDKPTAYFSDTTDGIGFIESILLIENNSFEGKHILLLGAGGLAHSILPLLLMQKIKSVSVYNRTEEKAHLLQRKHPEKPVKIVSLDDLHAQKKPFDMIINCTSSSVYRENLALPDQLVDQHTVCYDCAYLANERTLFEQWALNSHAQQVTNGLSLLVMQAVHAITFYSGYQLSREVAMATVQRLRQQFWTEHE